MQTALLQLLLKAVLGVEHGNARIIVRHQDRRVGKVLHACSFGLIEQIQVALIIHIIVCQHRADLRHADRRDHNIRAVADAMKRLRILNIDHGGLIALGAVGGFADLASDGDNLVPLLHELAQKITAEVPERTGKYYFHTDAPLKIVFASNHAVRIRRRG